MALLLMLSPYPTLLEVLAVRADLSYPTPTPPVLPPVATWPPLDELVMALVVVVVV